MKPLFIILENNNYLVTQTDSEGLPMFIEMSPIKYIELYGT